MMKTYDLIIIGGGAGAFVAAILAREAGELIAQAMMLVKNKNTVNDVINMLPMFPMLSESLKAVALSFDKDLSRFSCCI
jgi:mercuric reductase